eukprot:TRINITY_DN1299_c0_g1_i2.p1 TRINITY_DN1299_c0_g1~~TRINITY_DN1299_c0_g1_i2.p1  ORF type:complete len:713 (-),score=179.22 TRINITY_DN1299_c0_g1_i2:458-2596(-)
MLKSDKKRKGRSTSKSHGTVPAFLLKTYEILENPTYTDIISWNKEGNAFIVKKVNEFSEKILPKYFKHNNFASFVRQLNMYDFHKTRHDNNENEFRHRQFRRGYKNLLGEIKRKTSENTTNQITQLVSNKELNFERFRKDYNFFMQEMINLRNKQEDLEQATNILISQNNQILAENKLLWNELLKNKEKSERKIEKLILLLLSFISPNGVQPIFGNVKKNLMDMKDLGLNNASINGDTHNKNPSSISSNDDLTQTENGSSSISEGSKEESSERISNEPRDHRQSSTQIPDDQLETVANTTLCNFVDKGVISRETDKFIKKILKHVDYNPKGPKGRGGEGNQKFDSIVDNYHKNNSHLLKNLMNFVNSCEKSNNNILNKLNHQNRLNNYGSAFDLHLDRSPTSKHHQNSLYLTDNLSGRKRKPRRSTRNSQNLLEMEYAGAPTKRLAIHDMRSPEHNLAPSSAEKPVAASPSIRVGSEHPATPHDVMLSPNPSDIEPHIPKMEEISSSIPLGPSGLSGVTPPYTGLGYMPPSPVRLFPEDLQRIDHDSNLLSPNILASPIRSDNGDGVSSKNVGGIAGELNAIHGGASPYYDFSQNLAAATGVNFGLKSGSFLSGDLSDEQINQLGRSLAEHLASGRSRLGRTVSHSEVNQFLEYPLLLLERDGSGVDQNDGPGVNGENYTFGQQSLINAQRLNEITNKQRNDVINNSIKMSY